MARSMAVVKEQAAVLVHELESPVLGARLARSPIQSEGSLSISEHLSLRPPNHLPSNPQPPNLTLLNENIPLRQTDESLGNTLTKPSPIPGEPITKPPLPSQAISPGQLGKPSLPIQTQIQIVESNILHRFDPGANQILNGTNTEASQIMSRTVDCVKVESKVVKILEEETGLSVKEALSNAGQTGAEETLDDMGDVVRGLGG
ncbi:hypothetical protein M231_05489 [Tremella mesenterica]|uniref:Uncharacterized protein n=1 Tax=Tremella mesenterica TaxID=5217 RepID=A0A4Q1BI01_TREME|nr:hypothetical protein M231_05489 [Tremella mesenterica]